ncbi:MAG: M2 family metallopeptidase [Anaerohalosphaera sp.]|nr:M2 family metallopeptidase [Anaerohalosphaera sp.]
MTSKYLAIITLFLCITLSGCKTDTKTDANEDQLNAFISSHLKIVIPMEKEATLAEWAAATTGKPEDYEKVTRIQLKIRQIYSDPAEFAFLDKIKKAGPLTDPVLQRQLDKLHNDYLVNQIDPDLLKQTVELSTAIQEKFNTYRSQIDGNVVTSNQIDEILKSQTDSTKRKTAWLAAKSVAPVIAADIVKLVKLRNKAAQKVGYDNFHILSLKATEQEPAQIDEIFENLFELTKAPYAKMKAELDAVLAANCGIPADQIMPWHYHDAFFQETPLVYGLDLDQFYKGKDIKALSAKFYDGIGLNVESILAVSDLYERPGKNPHAFCIDIDREGDIRILCNIIDNERWMEVQLHELGHAVYDKFHDPKVPYLLRKPTHAFATEGIAMFFGRLSRNPVWMQQMLELSDEQRSEVEKVSDKYATMKQLIFARWAMVMYNFEKQLYANPDQDLNRLWWDTVQKYQLITPPPGRNAPDWAAKIHFNIAPCYYHNYLLGELFASQLHNRLVTEVLKLDSDKDVSYVAQPQVGSYISEHVFAVGAIYNWNDMIERATGEKLNPAHFVKQFVK